MTPEGWLTLVTAVAVALIGGGAGVRSASIARKAQRDSAHASPYEVLRLRVLDLEARAEKQDARLEALEGELDHVKDEAARKAAAFRARIQVLLRHIAALDEYAEMLVDLIRLKVTTVTTMPKKPDFPPDATDEL